MIKEFETALESAINVNGSKVKEAMNYSLLAGGKRIRPMMLLALLHDLNCDYKMGIPSAIALEMIHTYSLVHDDLPAMDNDDFRRHKPTNHKVYGEGVAILAGDALLNDAFMMALKTDAPADVILDVIEILGRNAGPEGMILGQEIDIANQFDTLETLTHSYELKTGCLFSAALECASVLANQKILQKQAQRLAFDIGIYFQYQDDILEYTSDFEQMGKNLASDASQDKKTIVTFLGLEAAQSQTAELFKQIQEQTIALCGQGILYQLIMEMAVRKN